MFTKLRVAAVAALISALALVVAAPPAFANHDPNPPYVASSQPGGHELYGFHHKQTGATTNAWLGLQRRSDGAYRWWGKAQGDGRLLAATFSEVTLVASPNTWGPTTCTTGTGSTVYCYGGWHQITDLATVSVKVNVRYVGGLSTGDRCLDSYIIRKGQRAAFSGPRSGC